MMRRMGGSDAFMIHSEQKNAAQHTLKIAILDPSPTSTQSVDDIREMMRVIVADIPFMRWRYLKVPLGLHHPVWVEDPDFDMDYHIRHIACPAPGDNRALSDLIAQLYITPLDHRRPLWLMWTIQGLQGGRIANVVLLHHAYTDGSGAAAIMHRCFRAQPFRFFAKATPWNPPPLPSRWRLLLDAVRDWPVTWLQTAPQVLRGLIESRKLAKRFAAEGRPLPPDPVKDARDSPFNSLLSACRSFAFETFDLARVKSIGKNFDVTINDLFIACMARAYRRFMIDKGFDPDAGPLIAGIPISRRAQLENDDGVGNMTTADFLSLPVHLSDATERLAAAHKAGNILKEHSRAAEGADISTIMNLLPAFAVHALGRHILRTHGQGARFGNMLLSNVAGPKEPLYLGDFKLNNWLSIGQVMQGMAVNTTVWSYAGKFNVCVLGDRKVLPDAWTIVDYFREALEEYERLGNGQVEKISA